MGKGSCLFEQSKTFSCLISEEKIQERVGVLGREIADHYRGKPLTLVGILKGAFVFMADLIRATPVNLSVDFLEISTYGDKAKSSGVIKINKDLKHSVEGTHVLLVEDIIDTGLTMRYLVSHFEIHNPLSVGICALLRKKKPEVEGLKVDYVGFDIEDEFVVGYGLDYAGQFRNLNDIRIVPRSVYADEGK